MENKKDNFNEGFRDSPEFNSGIDYLKRISTIINAGHVTSADRDGKGLLDICVQLLTELRPRINDKTYDTYKRVEDKLFKASLKDPNSITLFRNASILFRSLNHQVHTEGLGMRDAESGSGVFE